MTTAKQLTTKQLTQVFGVAQMTIHNWRKGTPTRSALPCQTEPGTLAKPRVFFDVSTIKEWARRNAVAIVLKPEDVLKNETEPVKPGPKPRPKKLN